MGKKYVGYGDFFCTNCGERIENGARNCPNCGAPYTGRHRYEHCMDVEDQRTPFHISFLRYQLRMLRGVLIFAAVEALGIFLLLQLDGHFDAGIYGWVLMIVMGFQLIWVLGHLFAPRQARKLQQMNRAKPAGPHRCLMCSNQCDARDNFCGRCGCIILK